MVFVDFDKENINIQDFRQNISSPARSSAFFMYTVFFLQVKSSWRNIGFTIENTVENVRWMLNPNTKHLYDLVFDNIFDSKSNISPWRFDFQKKNSIHEKCGRASPIRNILAKVLDIYVFPVKISKNHRKCCKLFTVWFPKEMAMSRFFRDLTGVGTKISQISIFIFFGRHSTDFQDFCFVKSIRIFTAIDWA